MKNPVFLAIDTPHLREATQLVDQVRDHIGGIKLGLEFFASHGQSGVREMQAFGLPIFLDLKFHDIPNTVGKTVKAIAPLSPAIITVHATGGRQMLEYAKAAAPPSCKVVAVTVLTSLDANDLKATGIDADPNEQVKRLTELARSSGIDGIVCSGNEVAAAKQLWADGYFVVPGVRPGGTAPADQKRTITPRAALDAGASIIVVGRPIATAKGPGEAASAIVAAL